MIKLMISNHKRKVKLIVSPNNHRFVQRRPIPNINVIQCPAKRNALCQIHELLSATASSPIVGHPSLPQTKLQDMQSNESLSHQDNQDNRRYHKQTYEEILFSLQWRYQVQIRNDRALDNALTKFSKT